MVTATFTGVLTSGGNEPAASMIEKGLTTALPHLDMVAATIKLANFERESPLAIVKLRTALRRSTSTSASVLTAEALASITLKNTIKASPSAGTSGCLAFRSRMGRSEEERQTGPILRVSRSSHRSSLIKIVRCPS